MPQTSVIFGLALCGLTVFGMVGTAEKLATAFVPMMLGIPLVFCGIVSLNPHRRKNWMWIAGAVATTGLLASAVRLLYQLTMIWEGEWVNRFSLGLLWGIFGLCLVFLVVLGLDLFRQHRRRKGNRPPLRQESATLTTTSDPHDPQQLAPSVPPANNDSMRKQTISSSLGA